jgi:hypothetical protein
VRQVIEAPGDGAAAAAAAAARERARFFSTAAAAQRIGQAYEELLDDRLG